MLKFTYGEAGVCLEHLSQSVEHLIRCRATLALRTKTRLFMEPCSASFLLPADLDQLPQLQALATLEQSERITLSVADPDCVEVSVSGLWICSDPETVEGIFVLSLNAALETLLVNLWQRSQLGVSVV